MAPSIDNVPVETLLVILTSHILSIHEEREFKLPWPPLNLPGEADLPSCEELDRHYGCLYQIRRVCRRWNDIVLSQPSWWSGINIDQGRVPSSFQELIILRSKGRPLHVAISGQPLSDSVLTHLPDRICSLALKSLIHPRPPFKFSSRTLKAIRLHFPTGDPTIESSLEWLWDTPTFSLERLYLSCEETIPPPSLFAHLSVLSLDLVIMTHQELLNGLEMCSKTLQHFRMTYPDYRDGEPTWPWSEIDGVPVEMCALKSLELGRVFPKTVLQFIQTVKFRAQIPILTIDMIPLLDREERGSWDVLLKTMHEKFGKNVRGDLPGFTCRFTRRRGNRSVFDKDVKPAIDDGDLIPFPEDTYRGAPRMSAVGFGFEHWRMSYGSQAQ